MMRDIGDMAKELKKALDSPGKEEAVCTMILGNDADTRAQIALYYTQHIDKIGLDEVLKKKLSGDYQHFCFNAFRSLVEYDCHQIYRAACKGTSTDKMTCYEIICTRPFWMLQLIKKLFKEIYGKDVVSTFKREISNAVGEAMGVIIDTECSENLNPDHGIAEQYAKELKGLKQLEWLRPEIFKRIFAQSSPEELVLLSRYMKKLYNKNLIYFAKDVLKNTHYEFLKTFLNCKINPAEFFADRLHEAVEGIGTDTNMVERILLTRSEIDMDLIRKFYVEKYRKELAADIEGDTSGMFRKLAIGLVKKMPDIQ